MALLGLFKKPKKKYYPKVKTTKTDQTEIENTQESELLVSIKRDVNAMLEHPCYMEYRNYLTRNRKTIAEGAYIACTSEDSSSVEEYVQALYYGHVVCILIYGYTEYTKTYGKIFHPFANEDMCLMQFLALEREDLSKGVIIDIMRTGIDEASEVYFNRVLVPFYERFDKFRYLEILKGERNHIEVMNAYYECKRKVSVLYPFKSSEVPSTKELVLNSGYQKFIDMNKDIICDIHEHLANRKDSYPMNLNEVVTELYDMVIIKHLLRVADYNQIIDLTEENMISYTVEMLNICLPMNLCWMPDNDTEKKILYEFKKRVSNMAVRKASKEFTDGILNDLFGEKRKYIFPIENMLIDKIYENGTIINGSIENLSTRMKASDAIKDSVILMLDEQNIGPHAIHCRYLDCGLAITDSTIEEIDEWTLVLGISLPVFDKASSIGDNHELRKVLVEQIDKFKEEYSKKQHDALLKEIKERDSWDPVEKEWDEFRGTGLFLIVNQFLHIFGWALCYNPETKQVKPGRVRYRGFSEGSVTRAYEKVQRYMINNAQELYEESDYDDQDE